LTVTSVNNEFFLPVNPTFMQQISCMASTAARQCAVMLCELCCQPLLCRTECVSSM